VGYGEVASQAYRAEQLQVASFNRASQRSVQGLQIGNIVEVDALFSQQGRHLTQHLLSHARRSADLGKAGSRFRVGPS
jgi:hypothetical protein